MFTLQTQYNNQFLVVVLTRLHFAIEKSFMPLKLDHLVVFIFMIFPVIIL